MKTKNILLSVAAVALLSLTSCGDDFLDRSPKSSLTPENYLNQENDLTTYLLDMFTYSGVDEVFYTETNYFTRDGDTDDMSGAGNANDKYAPGRWKTPQSGGYWNFASIRKVNYFLQTVLPKYNAGKIGGDLTLIKHDIGEAYMVRASIYFTRLKQLGDFPIIKEVLIDDAAILKAASKRAPQNEVARFIISDLDSAILLMKDNAPDGSRNRLSKPCAQLLKSRVALYEGTWLKYFKGTAFVPGGPGWPGLTKDYNTNFTLDIDAEIAYFLGQAMVSAKAVADITPLEANNKGIQQSVSDPVNKYFNMWNEVDLSSHAEVLFWRRYDLTLNVTNGVAMEAGKGNSGNGLTRGFIDSYLMANGLPIYDPASGYMGDDSINTLRINRDNRLQIFVKVPKQLNILLFNPKGDHSVRVEPYPSILSALGNDRYTTGYANRKGLSYDEAQYGNFLGYTGEVIFRGAEAYLNYIEACYEKTGTIDADASKYWKAIRTRAGVDNDFNKTIAATDVSKEALNDWGAYSAGVQVNTTLYNIRRERRNELEAEGFRKDDLRRWRAMDQMIIASGGTPYQIEGFKLWGPLQKWYIDPKTKKTLLKYNKGTASNVSDPALSIYFRPHQLVASNIGYDGYKWCMAHYLEPIAIQNFTITSDDYTDPLTSPIYQNPGWPVTPNTAPIGF